MYEYDVNGYHVIVYRMYAIAEDGREIDINLEYSMDFDITEEEIRGGMGTYKPRIKHIENADKYSLNEREIDNETT